jgi:hypothetical protein
MGLALTICCGLALGFPIWLNNQRLQSFAENLYKYPLPPNTEVVARHAEVGLMGNGNHCDFLASQTLVSAISRDEIEAYYQAVALPAVGSDSRSAINGRILVGLSFADAASLAGQVYFTVTLADTGYPPGFDIRCH